MLQDQSSQENYPQENFPQETNEEINQPLTPEEVYPEQKQFIKDEM
jgi:hypothetical protein